MITALPNLEETHLKRVSSPITSQTLQLHLQPTHHTICLPISTTLTFVITS
jgi:hypothetical protein